MVVLNFSDKEQNFKPSIPGLDFAKSKVDILLQSAVSDLKAGDDAVHLEPFGVLVTSISK
jgi:hypothetical protein